MVVRLIVVLVLSGWMVWSVAATVLYFRLRSRLRGEDHPELWLSRRERRKRARELLEREDEEYEQQKTERLTHYINERTQLPHEK
jgi:hypothetical protein